MDKNKKAILDRMDSILLFAGKDKTFRLGEWKEWREACEKAGQLLDPESYKAKKTLQ